MLLRVNVLWGRHTWVQISVLLLANKFRDGLSKPLNISVPIYRMEIIFFFLRSKLNVLFWVLFECRLHIRRYGFKIWLWFFLGLVTESGSKLSFYKTDSWTSTQPLSLVLVCSFNWQETRQIWGDSWRNTSTISTSLI